MRPVSKLQTRQIILAAISVALIAVGSFLRIPLPLVPITMQFLFVLLAAHLLRPLAAGGAVLAYLLLGLLGLPIFSGGGGIGYVVHPTFGYLIGFLFATTITAFLVGRLHKPTFWRLMLCNLAGYAALYFCGIGYYLFLNIVYFDTYVSLWPLLLGCWLVFLPGDLIAIVGSALISLRLRPLLARK